MRYIVGLLIALFALPAFSLDVGEFTLNGLDAKGRLVSYTPYVSHTGHQRDGEDGSFLRVSIDKFEDRRNHAVLTNCIWSTAPSKIVCGDSQEFGKQVVFEGRNVEISGTSEKIKPPIEVRRIQKKLRTTGQAFFVCTSRCKRNLPRALLLVYEGD